LDSKRIDILKKVFNYTDDKKENSLIAYHYKDKEDVVKEYIGGNNGEDVSPGCIQQ